MKLSEWAKKQGISYLTAYRWFKDGKLPVEAYQSDSGTIIVQDDSDTSEQNMSGNAQVNNVMSLILKKTVELSKNNASIEDFAAYILSNFQLKLNASPDSPRYSKNKPKSEDVQKHFKQFLKPKGEKPKPNMFVAESSTLDELVAEADNLTTQELISEINLNVKPLTGSLDNNGLTGNTMDTPEIKNILKDLSIAFSSDKNLSLNSNVKMYDVSGAEGMVNRSDNLTPQNYTESISSTFSPGSVHPTYDIFSNNQILTNGLLPTDKTIIVVEVPGLEQMKGEINLPTQKSVPVKKTKKGSFRRS